MGGRRPGRIPAPQPQDGGVRSSMAGGSASASSTQPLPADKQATNAAAADFFSPTTNWGMDPRPPGGFVNFMQNAPSFLHPQQLHNQPAMPHNFHFVGGPANSAPFSTPRPAVATGIPSQFVSKSNTPVTSSGLQSQPPINIDSGDDDGEIRTDKRLAWTKEEDMRLMSAWLNNSNDPINGNNKRSEQYWRDVTAVYNSTTEKHRRRQVKQAKDHWHGLNKMVYQFHCSYNKADAIYASGECEKKLMERAHAFYEQDYKGQFRHVDCWEAVKKFPKWYTYNEWLVKLKKRSVPETEKAGGLNTSPTVAEDIKRPIGTKNAKAGRNGKGKVKETEADVELLEKFLVVQTESKKSRDGMIEVQERLSAEKLETAKLSAAAAKETNEAKKQEKEAEMIRTYRALIILDTTGMTDEMKNEHMKTIQIMRERIFGV